jgi:predicted ATPase
MIKKVKLENFLSFGENSEEIELQPLNILIGANGSGKSNFIEAFNLLQNTPINIRNAIRDGGMPSDWIYKGENEKKTASLSFEFEDTIKEKIEGKKIHSIDYFLSFESFHNQFGIVDEIIDFNLCDKEKNVIEKRMIYEFKDKNANVSKSFYADGSIKTMTVEQLRQKNVDNALSVFSQKSIPNNYTFVNSVIDILGCDIKHIKLYRDWIFGKSSLARHQQRVDLPADFLDSECSNLCLVLGEIAHTPAAKDKLIRELKNFYANFDNYEIISSFNSQQLFFRESGMNTLIPANRLSDGTLRYLCLLSILCHPTPPPLVCIEEPELGLHPNIIHNLARLLKEASERTQLIVTTHSPDLVDYFNDEPEVIIVTEKGRYGTTLKRLDKAKLQPWLDNYRLGELWASGEIGGT